MHTIFDMHERRGFLSFFESVINKLACSRFEACSSFERAMDFLVIAYYYYNIVVLYIIEISNLNII